jgi:hypothetical protein
VIITARAYPVMGSIAIEASVISPTTVLGRLGAQCLVSQLEDQPPWDIDEVDVIQSLCTALQEWVWNRRGV